MFRQFFDTNVQFIRFVAQRFDEDQCTRSAAALTYLSLFAVVPLMTVIYSMFAAMPAFEDVGLRIQDLVFEHFMPDTGDDIQAYLEEFSTQARTLTGAGIAFLLVTAVFMLKNIEKTFNAIWRTRGHRTGVSSFLLYWAVLSLGPLCIGAAMALSTYALSLEIVSAQLELVGAMTVLPFFFTCAAFTLIYVAMPNTRVPFKHALLGGLVAGISFELAKLGFAELVQRSSYTVIYGAFAAIPLFLLWIYLSWVIVLAGAELVHALSSFDQRNDRDMNHFTLILGVLELLWRRHRSGALLSEQELLRGSSLFGRYSVSTRAWETFRERLLEARLIRVTENNHFVLGRSLANYSLWDLIVLLKLTPPADIAGSGHVEAPWLQRCQHLLAEVRKDDSARLDIPLAQLFADTSEDDARLLPTQVA